MPMRGCDYCGPQQLSIVCRSRRSCGRHRSPTRGRAAGATKKKRGRNSRASRSESCGPRSRSRPGNDWRLGPTRFVDRLVVAGLFRFARSLHWSKCQDDPVTATSRAAACVPLVQFQLSEPISLGADKAVAAQAKRRARAGVAPSHSAISTIPFAARTQLESCWNSRPYAFRASSLCGSRVSMFVDESPPIDTTDDDMSPRAGRKKSISTVSKLDRPWPAASSCRPRPLASFNIP